MHVLEYLLPPIFRISYYFSIFHFFRVSDTGV